MKTDPPFKVLPWLRAVRDKHAEARQRMSPREKAEEDRAAETLIRKYEECSRKAHESPPPHARVAERPEDYGRKKQH